MACGKRCVTDPDMPGVLGLSSVGQSHPGGSVSEALVMLCEQVALTVGGRRMPAGEMSENDHRRASTSSLPVT